MPISNPSLPTVPDGLHVDELTLDPSGLLLLARTTAAQSVCPGCGQRSSRVRSRYWRTLQDLPWQDRAVTWRVEVRRFRCSHCPGRIFVERILGLMGSKARRTTRLAEAQTEIGMMLGGEAGARLSPRLSMPVSGDTVLRLMRRHPPRAYPVPRVVGIQLVPYHSKEGAVATKVANDLPSSRTVQSFVQDALLRRVRSGDAALIVARSAKLWGVTTEEPGVVVYGGAEPRRAFQTSGSRGGKLLREMLRSKIK